MSSRRAAIEQQRIVPEVTEAIIQGVVTSFSEPERNRVVMLVDADPDRLYRLITHELTHIFAFDIWQFLVEVRRNVVNGAADPYQAALSRTPAESDSAFARYLRERFSP